MLKRLILNYCIGIFQYYANNANFIILITSIKKYLNTDLECSVSIHLSFKTIYLNTLCFVFISSFIKIYRIFFLIDNFQNQLKLHFI